MLRSKDLNEELKKLDLVAEKGTDEKTLLRSIVKGISLLNKLFRDIRTNQVRHLQHLGVELIKPGVREGRDKGKDIPELKDKKEVEKE